MGDFKASKERASNWHHNWLILQRSAIVNDFNGVIRQFQHDERVMLDKFFGTTMQTYACLIALMWERNILQEFKDMVENKKRENNGKHNDQH